MYRLKVTPEFEQDLASLDPQTGRRILAKVEHRRTAYRDF